MNRGGQRRSGVINRRTNHARVPTRGRLIRRATDMIIMGTTIQGSRGHHGRITSIRIVMGSRGACWRFRCSALIEGTGIGNCRDHGLGSGKARRPPQSRTEGCAAAPNFSVHLAWPSRFCLSRLGRRRLSGSHSRSDFRYRLGRASEHRVSGPVLHYWSDTSIAHRTRRASGPELMVFRPPDQWGDDRDIRIRRRRPGGLP
jgi:hypothetical protein